VAISITSHNPKIKAITQTMMPAIKTVSWITLIACVIMAAENAFPGFPKHSPGLALLRLGSALVGSGLIKAVRWQKNTDI
jgi:hypothetical protein